MFYFLRAISLLAEVLIYFSLPWYPHTQQCSPWCKTINALEKWPEIASFVKMGIFSSAVEEWFLKVLSNMTHQAQAIVDLMINSAEFTSKNLNNKQRQGCSLMSRNATMKLYDQLIALRLYTGTNIERHKRSRLHSDFFPLTSQKFSQ